MLTTCPEPLSIIEGSRAEKGEEKHNR